MSLKVLKDEYKLPQFLCQRCEFTQNLIFYMTQSEVMVNT